ncbi:PREDICTED: uncharacterized protein LOC101300516 [Fragaria vesca subsp. vesca]
MEEPLHRFQFHSIGSLNQSTNNRDRPKTKIKNSKSLLLLNIFPKLRSRKASTPSSPASSSSPSNSRSSSTSSASSVTYYSVPSSPVSTPARNHCARGRTLPSPRVQPEFDSGMLYPHEYGYGSRVSTTTTSGNCYSHLIKVLLREFHQ